MRNILTFTFFIIPLILLSCSKKTFDDHEHAELTTGQDFYNYHCAQCHRESGMGQVMKGIPPVIYSKLTHSQMRKWIMQGIEGGKMPVFKNMPKAEARKITRYINKLGRTK